jgi:sulfite exporter TauE/SafE
MSEELTILLVTAASLGFVHTSLGPDHYVPFIAMSKARHWSVYKTSLITIVCGIGHVLGSVIIGLIGIAFGIAITKLQEIESTRGEIAAWLLISFGLVYLIWGLRKAYRNKPHSHIHFHQDGEVHVHTHTHEKEHIHIHQDEKKSNITPWILFTIFVFGPCEVLIPLFMYTASLKNTIGLVLVTSFFGLATILTMLIIVLVSLSGIKLISFNKIEKYTHALAGAIILFCGLAIKFLGL